MVLFFNFFKTNGGEQYVVSIMAKNKNKKRDLIKIKKKKKKLPTSYAQGRECRQQGLIFCRVLQFCFFRAGLVPLPYSASEIG